MFDSRHLYLKGEKKKSHIIILTNQRQCKLIPVVVIFKHLESFYGRERRERKGERRKKESEGIQQWLCGKNTLLVRT